MGKRSSRSIRRIAEPPEFVVSDDVAMAVVFEKLRSQTDGLAATLVVALALGIAPPDWVRSTLVARQLRTDFSSATRPRTKKLNRQTVAFIKELLRYGSIRWFDPPRAEDGNDRIERTFEEIEGLWFAPRDSSGLKKSYYRFQHRFGRLLAEYVAVRVVQGWMGRNTEIP